jgi:hypothetical protein
MSGLSAADHVFNVFTDTKEENLATTKSNETRHCSIPSPVEIETFRAKTTVTGFHERLIVKDARKAILPQ